MHWLMCRIRDMIDSTQLYWEDERWRWFQVDALCSYRLNIQGRYLLQPASFPWWHGRITSPLSLYANKLSNPQGEKGFPSEQSPMALSIDFIECLRLNANPAIDWSIPDMCSDFFSLKRTVHTKFLPSPQCFDTSKPSRLRIRGWWRGVGGCT